MSRPPQPGPQDIAPQAEFVTTDPERAHAFMREVYTDNAMRITGRTDGFRMRHTTRETAGYSSAVLTHTMAVEHAAQPLGRLLVGRLLSGRMERETGGESLRAGPGDVFLIARPELPYTVRWQDMTLQLVTLPAETLAAVGGAPPRFDALTPHTSAQGALCGRVLDFVTGDLLPDRETAGPLVMEQAARLLASTVLRTFAHTPQDEAHTNSDTHGPAASAVLRAAMDYIEANAAEPIGLPEIAAAACAAPRTVQHAFRRRLGTTPLGYLRRVRLEWVHRELRAADAGRTTVTEVATRWGFCHPGRFAAAYRATYGQQPHETLRGH